MRVSSPWLLTVLTLANLLSYADRAILAVLVQPIEQELGIGDAQMGLLSGVAFALLYGFAALPIARLADRADRPTILTAGILLWSVATAASGTAQGFVHLLLCRIGVGAGEAGNSPISHALIAASFSRRAAPAAFGIFAAGSSAGMMVGLIGGGWAGEQLGWRMAFVVAGMPGLLLAGLTWFTIIDPRAAGVEPVAREPLGPALRSFAGLASFRGLALSYGLWIFLTNAALQWMPAFFVRRFAMTLGEVGLMFGVAFGLGSMLGTILGGLIGNRIAGNNLRRMLWLPMFSASAYIPLYALALFTPDRMLATAAVFAASILCTLGVGPLFSALQAIVAPHRRATAAAVYGLVSSIVGIGGAPLFVGVVSQSLAPTLGPAGGLRIAIGLAMLAALPMLAILVVAARSLPSDITAARR